MTIQLHSWTCSRGSVCNIIHSGTHRAIRQRRVNNWTSIAWLCRDTTRHCFVCLVSRVRREFLRLAVSCWLRRPATTGEALFLGACISRAGLENIKDGANPENVPAEHFSGLSHLLYLWVRKYGSNGDISSPSNNVLKIGASWSHPRAAWCIPVSHWSRPCCWLRCL